MPYPGGVRYFAWILGLLAGCSYYDSSLLAPTGEISNGPGGAGGEGGEAGAGGGPSGAGGGGAGVAGSGGGAGSGAAGGAGGAGGTGGAGGSNGETQIVGCAAKPIGPPKEIPTKKDGVEFVLAIKELDFGEKKVNGEPLYKNYGFDLDGYCSCPNDFTCKGADPNTSRYCDGPDGRDNAGGALITTFASVLDDFGSESINKSALGGSSTVVFQVRQYNGEANDDQVEVAWMIGEDFNGNGGVPVWDGKDVWNVQKAGFLNDGAPPLTPRFADPNAYVRDYVIVATLLGGSIGGADLSITLTAPLMVATLIPPTENKNFWSIDSGTVAARWDTKDIFKLFRRFNDPVSKQPLCTDNPFYVNIKSEICKYADIPLGVQVQPNVPCSALSIALRFTAAQIGIGSLIDTQAPENNCGKDNDPANDSCDLTCAPSGAAGRVVPGPGGVDVLSSDWCRAFPGSLGC